MLFFLGLVVLIAGIFFEVSLDHRVLAAGSMICGIALFYVTHGVLGRKLKGHEAFQKNFYFRMDVHEIGGHPFAIFTDTDGQIIGMKALPSKWTEQARVARLGWN